MGCSRSKGKVEQDVIVGGGKDTFDHPFTCLKAREGNRMVNNENSLGVL